MPSRRVVFVSAVIYLAAIAVMGRHVLAGLGSTLVNDVVDPGLNAAILAWNATHVPGTHAWFQFPIFHPIADGITLSEHLLGVSVIASPIYWLTGNPMTAYNLALLLSYPLSGLAMFALVWRLTKHAPASFLAGLAYAFTPYRITHLAHIQMLFVFWAPLALLGLHAYAETGRRRWLALFGAAWLLQGAANGYLLVYLSVVVGLWVLWFIVSAKRWRDLGLIALAGLAAAAPLVPILIGYATAHEHNGFVRSAWEVAHHAADVASVLCAPAQSSTWGWLQTACRREASGEQYLFPGLAVIALCVLAGWAARPASLTPLSARARWLRVISRLCASAAVVSAAIAASVVVSGPWVFWVFGAWRVSASTPVKPFTAAMILLVLAFLTSSWVRTLRRQPSLVGFYVGTAALTFALSWGPLPLVYGNPAMEQGPFAWLLLVPGVDSLRVPARFFLFTVLCLIVLMGLLVARALRHRPRHATLMVVGIAAIACLADGWTTLPAAPVPPGPPSPETLRGGVVLTLPLGDLDRDSIAQLHAVSGGWHSVNGWSGYTPGHYQTLRSASRARDALVMEPFRARGTLHVLVPAGGDHVIPMVEAQPDAGLVAIGNGWRQYRLPQRGDRPLSTPTGHRLDPISVSVSCAPERAQLVRDGDYATRWECGPQAPGQELTADLGRVTPVGGVVPALGRFPSDPPRDLAIDVSVDGQRWEQVRRSGSILETLEAQMNDPKAMRLVYTFSPRPARYVRLRQLGRDDTWYWSIAELEIWSGE